MGQKECSASFGITDGHAGLNSAVDYIYPKVKRQRCWAHKLRNVSKYFYYCPYEIRVKVRTTNIIERVLSVVRRRTRPMSCFNNVQGIERIVYAVMSNLNDQWWIKTLKEFAQND